MMMQNQVSIWKLLDFIPGKYWHEALQRWEEVGEDGFQNYVQARPKLQNIIFHEHNRCANRFGKRYNEKSRGYRLERCYITLKSSAIQKFKKLC